jgi:putative endonuclease
VAIAKNPSQRAVGTLAEAQAADFLVAQGLKILARQFTAKFGEIDLIVEDQGELVFVEVKMRQNSHFGGALAAVTSQKLHKIEQTGLLWLRQTGQPDRHYRIDVVAIEGGLIEWLKGVY